MVPESLFFSERAVLKRSSRETSGRRGAPLPVILAVLIAGGLIGGVLLLGGALLPWGLEARGEVAGAGSGGVLGLQAEGAVARDVPEVAVATIYADIFGGPAEETITQLPGELLLSDKEGDLYARIETGSLPLPRYTEAAEFTPVEAFHPQARPEGGSLNLLIADGDGDGKEDIFLPYQTAEGAGFRIYSGSGRLKLERSVAPPEGSFRTLFPGDLREGLLYLLAWAHDPHGPKGVVAFDLNRDRIDWFFHTPSDPLALRPTKSGYLISHATPAQGVYEYIGVEKGPAEGYDGALHLYEVASDGRLLRALRVREQGDSLRGVGEFRLHPEDPSIVLLTVNGAKQLRVNRSSGVVLN